MAANLKSVKLKRYQSAPHLLQMIVTTGVPERQQENPPIRGTVLQVVGTDSYPSWQDFLYFCFLLVSLSLLVAWDGPATHSGFSCRPSFHLFVTLLDSLINWCHTWPWEMSDPIMLNRLYFFGTTVQSPCHVQLSPCETSKGNCLRTQWALDGQQPSQGANLWALKATRVHDLMS